MAILIIAGLVLGFAGFIGFNVYKDNQLEQELAYLIAIKH